MEGSWIQTNPLSSSVPGASSNLNPHAHEFRPRASETDGFSLSACSQPSAPFSSHIPISNSLERNNVTLPSSCPGTFPGPIVSPQQYAPVVVFETNQTSPVMGSMYTEPVPPNNHVQLPQNHVFHEENAEPIQKQECPLVKEEANNRENFGTSLNEAAFDQLSQLSDRNIHQNYEPQRSDPRSDSGIRSSKEMEEINVVGTLNKECHDQNQRPDRNIDQRQQYHDSNRSHNVLRGRGKGAFRGHARGNRNFSVLNANQEKLVGSLNEENNGQRPYRSPNENNSRRDRERGAFWGNATDRNNVKESNLNQTKSVGARNEEHDKGPVKNVDQKWRNRDSLDRGHNEYGIKMGARGRGDRRNSDYYNKNKDLGHFKHQEERSEETIDKDKRDKNETHEHSSEKSKNNGGTYDNKPKPEIPEIFEDKSEFQTSNEEELNAGKVKANFQQENQKGKCLNENNVRSNRDSPTSRDAKSDNRKFRDVRRRNPNYLEDGEEQSKNKKNNKSEDFLNKGKRSIDLEKENTEDTFKINNRPKKSHRGKEENESYESRYRNRDRGDHDFQRRVRKDLENNKEPREGTQTYQSTYNNPNDSSNPDDHFLKNETVNNDPIISEHLDSEKNKESSVQSKKDINSHEKPKRNSYGGPKMNEKSNWRKFPNNEDQPFPELSNRNMDQEKKNNTDFEDNDVLKKETVNEKSSPELKKDINSNEKRKKNKKSKWSKFPNNQDQPVPETSNRNFDQEKKNNTDFKDNNVLKKETVNVKSIISEHLDSEKNEKSSLESKKDINSNEKCKRNSYGSPKINEKTKWSKFPNNKDEAFPETSNRNFEQEKKNNTDFEDNMTLTDTVKPEETEKRLQNKSDEHIQITKVDRDKKNKESKKGYRETNQKFVDPRMEREKNNAVVGKNGRYSVGSSKQAGNSYVDDNLEKELRDKEFDCWDNMEREKNNAVVGKKGRYSGGSSKQAGNSYVDDNLEKELRDKEFDCWDNHWEEMDNFKIVKEIHGDLFEQPKDFSLAHCVAEDLRMGSGIAVAFKREFKNLPDLLDQRAKQGGLAILSDEQNGRFIYYLVTKKESSGKPTYYTLWKSLYKMREHIKEKKVKKLAVPRLACGLDRLEWEKVKTMLEYLFKEMEIEIRVCNFQQYENEKYDEKRSKSKIVIEHFPVTKIASGTLILYLATTDGEQDDIIKNMTKKFNFWPSFVKSEKKLGDIVYDEFQNYGICACIVRKTRQDPISFKNLHACIQKINKKNKAFGNECFEYVALQYVDANDYYDDLINEKLITMFINCLRNVDVYICKGDFED